jgi:uncharacterized protein YeaO (DUF488 family)
MAMPLKNKRWDEEREASDGFRLLICRYRPRALAKNKETWDLWWCNLAPSKELHAGLYGKDKDAVGKAIKSTPIGWEQFRPRFLTEMQADEPREMISILAEKVLAGQTITLLCSSSCVDPNHCHRTIMQELIESRVAELAAEQAKVPAAT